MVAFVVATGSIPGMQTEAAATPKRKRNTKRKPRRPDGRLSREDGISVRELSPRRYRVRARAIPGYYEGLDRIIVDAELSDIDALVARHAELRQTARNNRTRGGIIAAATGQPLRKRFEIEAECYRYYQEMAAPAGRPTSTLRAIERANIHLIRWARASGLTYLDELTKPTLKNFWNHEHALTTETGRAYKVSSVNQILKPIKTMLRKARVDDRALHLSDDLLSEALAHTPVDKSKYKKLHQLGGARVLDADEIQALLRAALRFDARPDKSRGNSRLVAHRPFPVAPDIAALLLTGTRRIEHAFLKCRAVSLNTGSAGCVLTVPEALSKTGEDRPVHMVGFSDIGAELLAAMVRGRELDEWLSFYPYQSLGTILAMLHRDYDAPECTPHDLRKTCATYQIALAHVDAHRRVLRMGHSIEMAHSTYVTPPRGLAFGAPTLEAAMCAVAEFRAVVDAALAYDSPPRREKRVWPTRYGAQVFAKKQPRRALDDALYPRGTVNPNFRG